MYFFDAESRPAREIRPGVTLRTTWLENMLLSNIDLLPNALIPPHHHPQEQISVILSGEVTMTIGGETRLLKPGDMYLVPADVEHGGQAGADGAHMIDVFSPVRQELQFQE
jgi:quercetin dioxygenase-like cupin family protein